MSGKVQLLALFVAGLALLALACDGRISDGQAARYAAKNADLHEALPVPPGARLLGAQQHGCSGSFRTEKSAACALFLIYQTTQPLIEVSAFYEDYFVSEGWRPGGSDSETSEYFYGDGFRVQVGIGLGIPLDACPDVFDDPDGNVRCRGQEIRRTDGEPRKYDVVIYPE